jgi:branched-chain amino acid transport system permease protein
LVLGYTGLFSVAHAAFYGIGAYISALLAIHWGWSFWATMLIAAIGAGLAGVLIAISTIRTRGDYLVMASFAFQIIIYSLFRNCISLTNGPDGLPGIPSPRLFAYSLSSPILFLPLAACFAILTILFTRKLVSSPFGRVLKAIRDDEIAALAMGKDVRKFKIQVFVLGASLAGVAGSLYAHYVTFISPDTFGIQESILILSMVIFGGMANLTGSIAGAAFLVALPETLRFIGVPNSVAAPLRQMFYGALLVLLMRWRPKGIIGEYGFR